MGWSGEQSLMEYSLVTIASIRTLGQQKEVSAQLNEIKTKMLGNRNKVFTPTKISRILYYLTCSACAVYDSYR